MQIIVTYVFFVAAMRSLYCITGRQKYDNSRLNYFDTDLLRYLAENRNGNILVSPASIKSVLAMILEGSGGNTEVEIRSALRLSPNKREFREQLSNYLSFLKSNTSGSYLQSANGVFISSKFKLKKEYEMMLNSVYSSQAIKLDYRDPLTSSRNINNWVADKTKGAIPSIIQPINISPSSEILLINALYFKSSWQRSFNPDMTRGACFYTNGVCRTVAMMEMFAEFNYAYVDNLRAHAVELPYAGGRYSMIVLMPQDREGCVNVVRDLPYMSVQEIHKLMEPNDVQLSLPKFTVDYSEDMVESLKNMRITSLFSTSANLTGITNGESPQVNNLFHKVYISVDETGTIAAAASSAMIIPLIEDGVQLRIDRPFLFFIRDNDLGLVLFEGKIEEPTTYVERKVATGSRNQNTRNQVYYEKNRRSFG